MVIILAFIGIVVIYTRFAHKYPEYAKTHVASIIVLMSHVQTITIIGSMQLGWPLVIEKLLSNINLPLMGYIPLPCILSDHLLKSILRYMETTVVLVILVSAWLYAKCQQGRDESSLSERAAWAEYFLSIL